MELFKNLLSNSAQITEHHGFSFEANQVLIEQLHANYLIERADMDSIVAAINGVKSTRIKNSLWGQLGDYCINKRFTIQCGDREQLTSQDDLISSFLRALDQKYWHSLFNRLNVRNVQPIYSAPKFEGYLTIYTDLTVIDFNQEECKKLLNNLQSGLFDQEVLKLKFDQTVENYNLEFKFQKDGSLKVLRNEADRFGIFTQEMSDFVAGALYFNDEQWYLNTDGMPKCSQIDLKGVNWMKFKNSNHILTMNKSTAELFAKFYGIEQA